MLLSTILLYLVAAIVGLVGYRSVRRGKAPVAVVLEGGAVVALAAALLAVGFGEGLFGLMRLAAHGAFGIVPFVLLVVALVPGRFWRRAVALLLAGSLSAVAYYAFRVEPYRLEVSRYRLVTKEVSRTHRIVVLADLQTDGIGDYELQVLREAASLDPDLLLLPGDYLEVASEVDYRRLAARLRRAWRSLPLTPPLGAFAVAGNTDPPGRWTEIFAGTSVRPLEGTTTVRTGELWVTGLSVSDSFDPRLRIEGTRGFHVVFGHYPDYALGRIEADLLVAGHTHGGQVRLPGLGPLVTLSRVPRSWAAGRTLLSGGRLLVVSRGIGMERGFAPRLRFLCRPQLVVVDLIPRDRGRHPRPRGYHGLP